MVLHAIPDSHRYPCSFYLINIVENVVVFLGSNSNCSFMLSCSRNAQGTFVEKLQLKIISFKIINIDISPFKKKKFSNDKISDCGIAFEECFEVFEHLSPVN